LKWTSLEPSAPIETTVPNGAVLGISAAWMRMKMLSDRIARLTVGQDLGVAVIGPPVRFFD
jgi:hypothetical protein